MNPLLNPTVKAERQSPFAGKIMREVCGPTTLIRQQSRYCWTTGSNIEQARVVHWHCRGCRNTALMVAVTTRRSTCLRWAIAYSDKYPLQFGRYESDNRPRRPDCGTGTGGQTAVSSRDLRAGCIHGSAPCASEPRALRQEGFRVPHR